MGEEEKGCDRRHYLFCVGFGTLGGMFLRLASTAFLDFFASAFKFLRFAEVEGTESKSSFLGGVLSL